MFDRSKCLSCLFIAGLSIAALLTSASADAQIIDWVTTVSAQQPAGGQTGIVVASDGQKYTQVTDGQVELWSKAYGLCRKPSKWYRTKLYITRLKGGGTMMLWDDANQGFADKSQSREYQIDKVVHLNGAERQSAVAQCNKLLNDQLSQGKTRREVLTKDQHIFQPFLFRLTHDFWCGGGLLNPDDEQDHHHMLTPITCQGFDFPPPANELPRPGAVQVPFQVTGAELNVDPKQVSVVTKAHLTVSGELEANRAGTAKIRVSHNGKWGPVTSIAFQGPGAKQFSFPLTIPCPANAGGESGGGGQSHLAGAPQGTLNGHLEFRVVSPPSPVKASNKVFYSVTCRPTPTVAPTMPDLVVELQSGTRTPLRAIVRNVGSGPSGPTQLEVRYPKSSKQLLVPPLGPGKLVEIPIDYPPGAGNDADFADTEVIVDSPPVVPELNENNNSSNKVG